jgi:hypothetical protein
MYRPFAADCSAAHIADLRYCRVYKRVVEELILAPTGAAGHDSSGFGKSRQCHADEDETRNDDFANSHFEPPETTTG